VVAALGIGVLVVIALSMRRRATIEVTRDSYGTARERLGEDRERRRGHVTDAADHVSDDLKAEAESTHVASQEPAQGTQQRGRETADEVLVGDTEETRENTREEIRRVKDPVRLRSLSGRPMMSVLRGSVRRSPGRAQSLWPSLQKSSR
jgi:hypothetical protein